MKVEVVTPVHIGTGEKKWAFFYHKNNTNYNCYEFSDILMKLPTDVLTDPSFRDELYGKSGKGGKQDSKRKMVQTFAEKVPYHEIQPLYTLKANANLTNLDIDEQVKTLNQPIIPGSSIKGVLENAVVYCFMKKYFKTHILPKLPYKVDYNDRSKYQSPNIYLSYIFDENPKDTENFLKAVYACLYCSDIPMYEMSIYQANRFMKTSKSKKGFSPNAVECLSEKQVVYGNFIQFHPDDVRIRKYKRPKQKEFISMFEKDSLIRYCNEYFIDCIKEEYDDQGKMYIDKLNKNKYNSTYYHNTVEHLQNIHNKKTLYLRIGKDTNWNFKGIGVLFKKLDNDFFKKNFKILFRPIKNDKIQIQIPTTRVAYTDRHMNMYFPGVIKITFDD